MDDIVLAPGDVGHGPGDVVEVGQGCGRPLRGGIERVLQGLRAGVAGGEEGDLVPALDQSLDQFINDQLGAPVVPRGDREERRRNHRDAHTSKPRLPRRRRGVRGGAYLPYSYTDDGPVASRRAASVPIHGGH